MGALAKALPSQVMAPGFDGLWDTHVSGVSRRTGEHFSFTWFSAGGTGALARQDGLSATAYPSGIAGVPAEVIETLAPLVVRRRELRADSGGPGTHRGGLGQIMEIEVLTDEPYLFSGLYERTKFPAPGLAGGRDGRTGRLEADRDIDLEPKVTRVLPADTIVTLAMPGGGGFASPYRRAPAQVLDDVRNGYVTAEAAKADYGVVVDTQNWIVDEAATKKLRRADGSL
jgi:N-methylhydantoinase B